MSKITNKADLPKWSTKDNRYSWLKDASIQHLSNQWAMRVAAYRDIEEGILDSEHLSLIYNNYGAFEDSYFSESITTPQYKSDLIWPLASGDVLQHANKINAENPDVFAADNAKTFKTDEGGILVNIAMSDLTNKEILSELALLLNDIRPMFPGPSANYNLKPQIYKLRKLAVFKFTDLFLWAASQGSTISAGTYVAVLNPDKYSPKQISDLLKQVKTMMSLRFTDQLELEINK